MFFCALSLWVVAQQPVVEWAKTYGGKYWDFGESILVTSDNKYVIAGGTSSQDNDTLERPTKVDGLIMKLDSDGKVLWKKTYGGNGHDAFSKIIQTKDGGFIAVGSSSSTDGLFTTNKGSDDVWILKLDSLGSFEWQKTYGGSDSDVASSIVQDTNGEYILVMSSSSKDKDFNIQLGTSDGWIVKIDIKGEIIWKKHFGGSDSDGFYDIIQTNNGLFIAVGVYRSKDSIFTGLGTLAIQFDTKGNVIWQKSHGSPYSITSYFNGYKSFIQTKDGNIVAFGYAWAFNRPSGHDSHDFLISKIDTKGNLLWSKMYGGEDLDVGQSVLELPSGELIVIGKDRKSVV